MDAFARLRQSAEKKRDAAIDQAKAEYYATLKKLGEAEQLLYPKRKNRTQKTLAELIDELVPDNRSFGVDDAVAFILREYPDRKLARKSVVRAAHQLIKAGKLKKIANPTAGRKALYARVDADVPQRRNMLDWAKEIDGWQEMEPVAVMVRMVENGFELGVSPKNAVKQLTQQIRCKS